MYEPVALYEAKIEDGYASVTEKKLLVEIGGLIETAEADETVQYDVALLTETIGVNVNRTAMIHDLQDRIKLVQTRGKEYYVLNTRREGRQKLRLLCTRAT